MAQEIIWHSIEETIARDTETGVRSIIAPPEAVTREADRLPRRVAQAMTDTEILTALEGV